MAAYNANVQSIWNLNVNCMTDQVNQGTAQLDTYFRRKSGATCSRSWPKEYVISPRDTITVSSLTRSPALPSAWAPPPASKAPARTPAWPPRPSSTFCIFFAHNWPVTAAVTRTPHRCT